MKAVQVRYAVQIEGLPNEVRRALACTNTIQYMQGTIRRVSCNVKRSYDADMTLRWAATGMMQVLGYQRLKAYSTCPPQSSARRACPKSKRRRMSRTARLPPRRRLPSLPSQHRRAECQQKAGHCPGAGSISAAVDCQELCPGA
jgi:hypothetical protein